MNMDVLSGQCSAYALQKERHGKKKKDCLVQSIGYAIIGNRPQRHSNTQGILLLCTVSRQILRHR